MMPVFPPPQQPTFYFIGVTTAQSSARRVFPAWMQTLGRPDVELVGLDFPIHDNPANYRRCVQMIKAAPLALGGLVTTHKIDLFEAASDLFDQLDPDAAALGEVSCIAKRNGRLVGFVSDPTSGGGSLAAITGRGYFGRTGAHLLCFGAGGSAAAMALHLLQRSDSADRPARMIVVNRSPGRLQRLQRLVEPWRGAIDFTFVHNEEPAVNDALLGQLPPHSIAANATGMGKDRPGSPITDAGLFPQHGIAWDFNYRGELDFLRQARAQQQSRHLRIEDGWHYFVLGWSLVIAYVLDIEIDTATLQQLAKQADALR
jgi:shikimate dehydrogenase